MSSPATIPPPREDEPAWLSALFPNLGYVRLWMVMVRIFLFFGVLGLLDQAWWIASEIRARCTWPTANGEIVSATQRDDNDFSLRAGSLSQRTRYWVEYEVRFSVTEDQCRTGIIYSGASETMPCHGIVRTRRTRTTSEAYKWLYHAYAPNTPVKVLHNPSGPEVKIAGSSIWLFYPWPKTLTAFIWVIVFLTLHAFLQRRRESLRNHPEAETTPPEGPQLDKYKLTSLDLS